MSGYNAKAFETKANEELFTHSVAESLDVASEDGIKIAGGCLPDRILTALFCAQFPFVQCKLTAAACGGGSGPLMW